MKNWKSKLIMLMVLSMVVVFTACANEGKQAVVAEEIMDVNEEERVLEENVEEVVRDEEEGLSEEDEVVNPESEVETYETAYDWVKSVDIVGPVPGIWNEETKQVLLLEDGANYLVKSGDRLILFARFSESRSIIQDPHIEDIAGSTRYSEYKFIEIPMEATEIDLSTTIDGVEHELSITVVSEEVGEQAFVELEEKQKEEEAKQEELHAWLEMSYDEPKLLVWNEETYMREAINDGGEYTLKEGDKIALYTPDMYVFDFAGASDGCGFLDALYEGQVAKIGYKLPEESMKLVLSHYMLDAEGGEIVASYTIITP